MQVITIFNTKGGTGKSTIACNLACEAAREGRKVLLIDSDTQQSSMDFRAVRAGDPRLPQVQAVSIVKPTLHQDVQAFSDFDVVLIDAGGRDTATHRSAVLAADVVLIPCLPSQYDVWASQGTVQIIEEARAVKPVPAFIVLNQLIPHTKVAAEAEEALKEFHIPLCTARLYSRVAYKAAIGEGKGVSEYEPTGKAAGEIKALWQEVKSWR